MPKPLPADPLRRALLDALGPCPHMKSTCAGTMQWEPTKGHVPRGFVGAFGDVDEVEVVVVTAEPGEPLSGERHAVEELAPEDRVRAICQFTYDQLAGTARRAPDYHDNVRQILDLLWPEMSLDEQLTKTWITESVLCSAPESGGKIPLRIEAICRTSYLDAQLRILSGRPVLALGGKAQERLASSFFAAGYHPSAAHGGTQKRKAVETWEAAAKRIRAAVQERARARVAETGTVPEAGIAAESGPLALRTRRG